MRDDLIKRSDVYKAVDDWLAGRVPNLNIKDIPSADRPNGEWIECKGGWKCTVCNKWSDGQYAFCPHCGAQMKGAR